MKKVLLASTALVMSAGIAAADVSVGGDGRMGVVDTFDSPTSTTDFGFTSRIRISFAASGETDAGLAFGGSVRVDNYEDDQATGGTEGSVFIEGTFGKVTMGDVSGAPEAAAGDLSGVGLTGLGDANELVYLSNSSRPAARWDYVTGDLGIHLSADNPSSDSNVYGIAVTYGMGNFNFGLGYESADIDTTGGALTLVGSRGDDATGIIVPAGLSLDADHIVGSVSATFGDATIKGAYGTADISGDASVDFDQYGVSADFVTGATTFTAYYVKYETSGDVVAEVEGFGIGASYDLGGGAALKGGWANIDASDADSSYDGDSFDFGISMTF